MKLPILLGVVLRERRGQSQDSLERAFLPSYKVNYCCWKKKALSDRGRVGHNQQKTTRKAGPISYYHHVHAACTVCRMFSVAVGVCRLYPLEETFAAGALCRLCSGRRAPTHELSTGRNQ